jgi:hypothetical protein
VLIEGICVLYLFLILRLLSNEAVLYAIFFGIVIFCSGDVEKLKKLILHNAFILTLPEVGDIKDEVIPKNVQQFWVRFAMPILGNYENCQAFLIIFLWQWTNIFPHGNHIIFMSQYPSYL